jgi:hypothetical protein
MSVLIVEKGKFLIPNVGTNWIVEEKQPLSVCLPKAPTPTLIGLRFAPNNP